MDEKNVKKKYNLSTKDRIKLAYKRTWKQFLLVDAVRYLITYPRRLWYMNVLNKVRFYKINSNDINPNTPRNFKAVRDTAVIRSNQLLRPLSIIEPIYSNIEDVEVLSIGPRTEGEILNLVAHGFSKKRIRAIDLFSYSPWIDIGDMHKMPYGDNSFDVILSGFVLAYSDNPKKAAHEMLRVSKNGGIMAIGVSYMPNAYHEEMTAIRGHTIANQLFCLDDIFELFKGSIEQIFFSQDLTLRGGEIGQNLLAIFSVKK